MKILNLSSEFYDDLFKLFILSIFGAFSAVIAIRINTFITKTKNNCKNEKDKSWCFYVNHHIFTYSGMFIVTLLFTFILYLLFYKFIGIKYF